MIDPVGCCPTCASDELILEHNAPDFDDCQYICIQCEWRGEGRDLDFIDMLPDEDDEDDW